MATNLSIENLSRSVQTGDAESFLGGRNNLSPVAPQGRVAETMRMEGMEVPNAGSVSVANGKTFTEMLKSSLEVVNQHQQQADHAIKELMAGRTKNVHETLLAIEKADSSLKLAMQVRNKILDAYREVMRMQI